MTDFPTEPKKIRERIKRYERGLRKDIEEFGFIRDGSGKRYLLGPLYMLANDVEGALEHFAWFQETFPDDVGDPWQNLCWTLALLRGEREKHAAERLRLTMFSNLYLIPLLLGERPRPHDIWHGSNIAETEYALEIPRELISLWTPDEIKWAEKTHEETKKQRNKYIELRKQLLTEPVGPRRNDIVNQIMAIEMQNSTLEETDNIHLVKNETPPKRKKGNLKLIK